MSETTNTGKRPEKPFLGLPRRAKPLHPALDVPPAPAKDAAGLILSTLVERASAGFSKVLARRTQPAQLLGGLAGRNAHVGAPSHADRRMGSDHVLRQRAGGGG